jgi:heme ABC exporter ATP-binding subunit CcmA
LFLALRATRAASAAGMGQHTNMIEVRGLAKYFGRFSALRDLNLDIKNGEFIAIFGRNGAGKTTFLRILAGLSRPSSGAVKINEASLPMSIAGRGMIGYLSHNTSLYGDLTALENLRFYACMQDLPTTDENLRASIGRVGLAGREQEPVRNYSRGMQQRLAIARAFLHNPSILLLDEPFTGLDQPGMEFLTNYLSEARGRGKTCLMAIHDAQLGYTLADRLLVIEKGIVALDLAKSAVSLSQFQESYNALVRNAG